MNRIIIIAALLAAACGGTTPDPAEGNSVDTQNTSTSESNNAGTEQPNDTNNSSSNNTAPNNTATNNASTTTNPTTADGVRLTDFHEEVFVAEGCTAGYCHGSFGLGSPQAVIDSFVNVEATEPLCGRTHFVVPGDPEASILWVRVRPMTAEDEECGVVKMPANSGTGLDEQTAQMIYEWIQDGAQL